MDINKVLKYLTGIGIVFQFSCQPRMHYIGSAYPPTTYVEIFFEKQDIPRSYKIIGKIAGIQTSDMFSADFQPYIIKTAQKTGADAVLVTYFGYLNTVATSAPDSGLVGTMHLNVKNDLILDAYLITYK